MADRICDNCMGPVPIGADKCPKCGIRFENTNPGGALPNGWVLAERYTVGRYVDIDGEGVTYSAIDGDSLQRVTVKEFMPVTLCAARDEHGAIRPKPGCEVLFKTTRMDFAELFGSVLRLGLVDGLVQVLDVFEENNTAYAVLEKIEGPTLAEYLTKRTEPVDAARALALLRPILNGVELMHAAGIVHRGISPDNVILESGGTAKLTGYGTLALRQQGSELKPKLFAGYSAPEQYAASEFEGPYTDIYAIGAVLYRLVTGEVPNSADERKMQDNLKPARALNKDIPAFLSAGIARSMRIAPAERIQTIEDLRLALAGESTGSAKGPLGLTKQQLIVGAVAAGAIVLLLLIILLVSVFSKGGKKPESSSATSFSEPSSVSVGEGLYTFVGKNVDDIIGQSYYEENFVFAEPIYEYVDDVNYPEGMIFEQTPAAGEPWDGKTPIQLKVSKGFTPIEMPNLTNPPKTEEQAKKVLDDNNIKYTIEVVENDGSHTEGTVVETSPTAGSEVQPHSTVVTIKVAGSVNLKTVPEVNGRTQTDAENMIRQAGFSNIVVSVVGNDGTQTAGTVQSVDPAAGTQKKPTDTITIYVYDKFYMPDLNAQYQNKMLNDLIAYLDARKIHFQYTTVEVKHSDSSIADGTIQKVDQPAVNSEITTGNKATITIYVYKYEAPPSSSVVTP